LSTLIIEHFICFLLVGWQEGISTWGSLHQSCDTFHEFWFKISPYITERWLLKAGKKEGMPQPKTMKGHLMNLWTRMIARDMHFAKTSIAWAGLRPAHPKIPTPSMQYLQAVP
jgi:hypothetical protein